MVQQNVFNDCNAAYFATAIEDTEHLLVSVVCLYEVFKKVNLAAGEAKAFRAVAQMKQGRIVEFSEEIALRAAAVSLRHKLPKCTRDRVIAIRSARGAAPQIGCPL